MVAVVVVFAALIGFAAPASGAQALPPLKIKNGQVELCQPTRVHKAFEEAGIALEAIAPAKLTTTGTGRPCVHMTAQGKVNLDLTDGLATMDGGFMFTHQASGAQLRFTHVTSRATGDACVVTAIVNDQPSPIEILTFDLAEASVSPVPVPPGVEARGPLRGTADAAAALQEAFGASPIEDGAVLFDVTGRVELLSTAVGAATGLLEK
ncbi:hypothetical protein [Amycolatopsis anabasis]|uniref:hypothetical protein n=1 Tax=Amycolatopsis anabasis TaxID=1840409 RepID=UPI00131D72BA|nr:hypothetical protein [Amycolatopsis anabasis]